ncbi:hypothetical protein PI124_g14771 [Phytophthora idaei]|nr:hypothetical protein PI124_g14771 [Phytophthora idaei]
MTIISWYSRMCSAIATAEAKRHEADKDRLKKENRELEEEVRRLIRAPQGSIALSEVERRERVLREELKEAAERREKVSREEMEKEAERHERREMAVKKEKFDLLNRMAQKDSLLAQKDALMAQKDKETQERLTQKDALMAQKGKEHQENIEKKDKEIQQLLAQ